MSEGELQAERARLLARLRKLGRVAKFTERNAEIRAEVESLEVQLDMVHAEMRARN